MPPEQGLHTMTTLYSWNVNGLRAITKKSFPEWVERVKPDILCLQETKARKTDVPAEVDALRGYESAWMPAKRPGYSGVGALYKKKFAPQAIEALGASEFDDEGRVLQLVYNDFVIINTYWPNSQPERARLEYKLAFGKALLARCKKWVKDGRGVIVCGDGNIAHKDIDLARPKQNRDNPGFYPEECAFMDEFLAAGFVDAFRVFNQEPDQYTWWSYRGQARANNVGWRLDYHLVDKAFMERVKKAEIHADVLGSDHCPVSLTFT
jgi:exodeoxyribonuclease-3